MALTKTDGQVLWSSSNTKSLNSTSRFDSDAVTVSDGDISYQLQLAADNSGTPASGDYVDVYIKCTNGDVKNDSSDDYDTDEHATYLTRLDTYGSNTPGEDPAVRTLDVSSIVCGVKGWKVSAVANQGGTRAVTFSARYSKVTQS